MFYIVFYDKCRYSDNHQVYKALFLYVVAKVTEAKDKAIFNKTGALFQVTLLNIYLPLPHQGGLLEYYLAECKPSILCYKKDAEGKHIP